MPLAAGSRLGPYEILGPLGAGGMGEVYRARDSRLDREVAIKSLPDAFAADGERLARFEREAKLLAALNHPNIGAIYGLEEAGDHRYLVLERVEGETLASRLSRGPLPVAESLEVCSKIAAALEAAHDAGIVHRDLKPGNVMVRPDGTVKVLDFGLAKGPASGAAQDQTQSPTLTSPATTPGTILGTAAYMSPEQARGRAVDRRADIWAWGCVLYECLAGKRAFEGADISETLAAILKTEPNWNALPGETPAVLPRLLARCLRKDARERQRDAGDVRIEVDEIARLGEGGGESVGTANSRSTRASWRTIVLVAVAAVFATLAIARLAWKSPEPAPLDVTIQGPEANSLGSEAFNAVISPDGATLALVARDTAGVTHLWLRELSTDAVRMVAGTEDAAQPFWSPDDRSLGFFAGGQLRRVSTSGEGLQTLCAAPNPRGGAWGADDIIVFAPAATSPLMQIRASGGSVRPATTIDPARGETAHRFPSFLPGGKRFLFVAFHGEPNQLETCVGAPGGGPRVTLLTASSVATYAPPGYLLFRRQGAIFAQRFDARSIRCTGRPRALRGLEGAGSLNVGAPIVSASQHGVVAQLVSSLTDERLEAFDRSGRSLGTLPLPIGNYWLGRVAPEGGRIALNTSSSSRGTFPSEVAIFDIRHGYSTKLTSGGSFYTRPLWTPDGLRVIYGADGSNGRMIYARRADAGGAEELLLADMPGQLNSPTDVSPDGKELIFRTYDLHTGSNIWVVPLMGERKPHPLIATDAQEGGAVFSPDGHYLAYWSDESGDFQVYVRRFPSLDQKSRISVSETAGLGNLRLHLPQWRNDGRELVFLGSDYRTVFAASTVLGAQLQASAPKILFRLPSGAEDVSMSPDAQRFYVLVPDRAAERGAVRILTEWWRGLEGTP